MIYLSALLFVCAGFFFLKSLQENSSNDRLMALILLLVALFTLFTGLSSLHTLKQYGL